MSPKVLDKMRKETAPGAASGTTETSAAEHMMASVENGALTPAIGASVTPGAPDSGSSGGNTFQRKEGGDLLELKHKLEEIIAQPAGVSRITTSEPPIGANDVGPPPAIDNTSSQSVTNMDAPQATHSPSPVDVVPSKNPAGFPVSAAIQQTGGVS